MLLFAFERNLAQQMHEEVESARQCGLVEVAVVEEEFFRDHQCLSDETPWDDLPPFFDDKAEEVEGIFAVEGLTEEEIKRTLEAEGLTYSEGFQTFLDRAQGE